MSPVCYEEELFSKSITDSVVRSISIVNNVGIHSKNIQGPFVHPNDIVLPLLQNNDSLY